jgi:hypothetical protein
MEFGEFGELGSFGSLGVWEFRELWSLGVREFDLLISFADETS